MTRLKLLVERFFKDKDGKWVILEFPNTILIMWFVTVIANMVITDIEITKSLGRLGDAVLFAWAYLELTKGSSYFRQTLGGLVLLMLVINFFR